MPLDQYVIGAVIGKGSYGEVTLATYKKDKKKYVIKTIDLHNASKKERIFALQEVDILSKLRHPNIVSYKESFETEGAGLAIVMGYCEGGDLYTRLKKQAKSGEYLAEAQIVEWFVQIAMALQYIHDRHILHRDLKTQNIFLTKSKIIKLGDLGIARVLDNNVDMATTMIGTPYYMSPELFSNKPYNHKSDVWALGCCVYEMATLKHAFNAKDMNALVYKILKGKTPPMPKRYTEELQEIIKSMLNYDPGQRPSASRILRHQFIKKHIAIFLEGTKNRRKSKQEKIAKSEVKKQPKPSNDSGFSEPLSDSNPQAIATSSNVEIEVLSTSKEEHEAPCQQKVDSKNDIQKEKTPAPPKKEKSTESRSTNARKILHERKQKKLKQVEQCNTDEEHLNNNSPLLVHEHKNDSNKKEVKPLRKHSRENAERRRKTENSKRPLPSVPKNRGGYEEKKDRRLPVPCFRDDSPSNSDPSEESRSPKCSSGVPNMAARRKRRQKQQEQDIVVTPPLGIPKRDSIASIVDLHTPRSQEEIVRAHIQRISHKDSVDGIVIDEQLQMSADDTSQDDSSAKNEDVSCLIDNLQATLKLESKTNDRQSPEDSYDSSSGGDYSPSATGRLNDRIARLRRECIDGVGETMLKRAYQIIDMKPEHQIENALIALLGRQKFDLYSGQIWQLKFCEEFKL